MEEERRESLCKSTHVQSMQNSKVRSYPHQVGLCIYTVTHQKNIRQISDAVCESLLCGYVFGRTSVRRVPCVVGACICPTVLVNSPNKCVLDNVCMFYHPWSYPDPWLTVMSCLPPQGEDQPAVTQNRPLRGEKGYGWPEKREEED